MKLCIIYNFAQHYRTEIFKSISEEFDCDWLFGDSMSDVKKMDYFILQGNVKETHTKRLFGRWYWQPGVIRKLTKNYTHYILLGETRALSTWLFCLLSCLFYPRKRVYFWSHGWYGKETALEKFIKKILFSLPNGGIFLYGNYARKLMIREGFNPDKLFVIHNSLAYSKQLKIRTALSHTNLFHEHFGNDNPNLIFIGRMTKIKRLNQLVEALSILKRKGFVCNLVIVGDGIERETLHGCVEEKGLQNNVWFYGACYDEQENAQLIYNADLCVSPGNVGLTAIHSMMFGCPVITHNNFPYQMPEFEAIRPGMTGDFFEYGNVDSLADCIKNWLVTHQSNREEIRENCQKEIDAQWTPNYQLRILKLHLQ